MQLKESLFLEKLLILRLRWKKHNMSLECLVLPETMKLKKKKISSMFKGIKRE